ncbi:hypothetical protein BLOT_016088 [Blomia tropicalis]|nr:hypothetical protein BLOT_016088 [Blomia tropicalis]
MSIVSSYLSFRRYICSPFKWQQQQQQKRGYLVVTNFLFDPNKSKPQPTIMIDFDHGVAMPQMS